jgi:hypothetical protein
VFGIDNVDITLSGTSTPTTPLCRGTAAQRWTYTKWKNWKPIEQHLGLVAEGYRLPPRQEMGEKPKKEKIKIIAAAPSQKGATAGWQPTFGSGKKK